MAAFCAIAFVPGGSVEDPLWPAELRWRKRKEKLPRHKDSEGIRTTWTTFKRDRTIARCAARLRLVLRRPPLPRGDGRMGRRHRRRGPPRARSDSARGRPDRSRTVERAHTPRRRDCDAGTERDPRGARRTAARPEASGPRESERRRGDRRDATGHGDDGADRDYGLRRLPRGRAQG